MSDIRFEGWLHRSGTGGVYQDSAGNVGIASTQPQQKLDIGNGGFQVGPTGITTVTTVNTTNLVNATPLSHRNKVINGGMMISQRNGTSSVQLSATEFYIVDRFKNDTGSSFDMKADASQVTDHPIGFSNAIKIQCDGVSTPSGSHNGGISTFLEGLDVQDFGFGSSGAQPITVSFYAKSASANSGQTFGFMLGYQGVSNGRTKQTRSFTVTDTWQRFEFTFEPNGASQSDGIVNTSAYGLQLFWSLAVGSDDAVSEITTWTASSPLVGVSGQSNLFDTVSNQFFLTGVQCEVGRVATPFEHRSHGDELRRCQRYFFNVTGDNQQRTNIPAFANSTTSLRAMVSFPTPMRATPTFSGSATNMVFDASDDSATFLCSALQQGGSMTNTDPHGMLIEANPGGMTAGQSGVLEFRANSGELNFSAEL